MKPSVGRIVHYVSYGTPGGEYSRECRAAIVTEVPQWLPSVAAPPDGGPNGVDDAWLVGLCVLNPTGQFFNHSHYSPGAEDQAGGTNLCGGLDFPGGTWHWPEKIS